MGNPIYSATQTYNGQTVSAPIGADAAYVKIHQGNNEYNLQDFYNNWIDFKEHNNFMLYADNAPQALQVKVWYNTSEN